MPVTYHLPDSILIERLRRVMEKWHPHLRDSAAKVAVLFASAPNGGDPLKSGGYPALAQVRVVPLRQRMFCDHDAEIAIDYGRWSELTDDEQDAVLDHELSHLLVVDAKYHKEQIDNGEEVEVLRFATDDIGRPKLKLQPADWNGGDGFYEVVRRHGESAVELLNARRCHENARRAVESQA